MIAIVNVSKEFSEDGEQDYELRINRKVISKFKHARKDGLVECLKKAAGSVDQYIYSQPSKNNRLISMPDGLIEYVLENERRELAKNKNSAI